MSLYAEGKPLVLVAPSRMAWEPWDHARNRDGKRGDINAAYSADKIAMGGSCKTFTHEGQLYTVVSLGGRGTVEQACAYKLVPLKLYSDVSHTYGEMRGQFTYNSMRVKSGKDQFVMVGPEVFFQADPSIADYQQSDTLFDLGADEPEACDDCGEIECVCQGWEDDDFEDEDAPAAEDEDAPAAEDEDAPEIEVKPVAVAPIAAEPEQLGLF